MYLCIWLKVIIWILKFRFDWYFEDVMVGYEDIVLELVFKEMMNKV